MFAAIATLSAHVFFFFNDPATTEIYTLSLHDALPIMPAKTGGYMCARNLQSLANDQQIILALLLHDNPIDVGALHPLLKAGRANLDATGITRHIGTALFDAAYASE